MKTKTIQIQPPLNTNIPAKTHCIGISADFRQECSERGTCALHVLQMTEPHPMPMLLARVGSNPCRYRVEAAK